jgi:hypothetical protein
MKRKQALERKMRQNTGLTVTTTHLPPHFFVSVSHSLPSHDPPHLNHARPQPLTKLFQQFYQRLESSLPSPFNFSPKH